MEKFRLRRFVEKLMTLGEVEVHEEKVDLADTSAIIEATAKTVMFQTPGRSASSWSPT